MLSDWLIRLRYPCPLKYKDGTVNMNIEIDSNEKYEEAMKGYWGKGYSLRMKVNYLDHFPDED